MPLKKIISGIILLVFAVTAFSQRVTDIKTENQGNMITIKYKIAGAKFNQSFDISLYISRDGGASFEGPMTAVSGDVGENVRGGKNQIVWEVFKDLNHLHGNVIFDVRAKVNEEKIRKQIFINPSSTLTQTYGLKAGMMGKTGWYIGVSLNQGSLLDPAFISDDEDVLNYDLAGYYKFDDEVNHSVLTLTAGLNFQLGRSMFWYLGGGYGSYELIWHINQYDYNTDQPLGDYYVRNDKRTFTGIAAETGFQLKFGLFLVSTGVTFYNFKYWDYNAGIGFAF